MQTQDSLFVNIEIDPSRGPVTRREQEVLDTMKRKPLFHDPAEDEKKKKKRKKGKGRKASNSPQKSNANNRGKSSERKTKVHHVKRRKEKRQKSIEHDEKDEPMTARPIKSRETDIEGLNDLDDHPSILDQNDKQVDLTKNSIISEDKHLKKNQKKKKVKDEDDDLFKIKKPSKCQTCVEKFLESWPIAIFMTIVTLYALFVDDLRFVIVPNEYDDYFYYATCVSMALFAGEMMISCYSKMGYICGFYFWLDFISTISLLTDVGWFMDMVSLKMASGGADVNGVVPSSDLAQFTGLLKLARLIRLVRIVKLFK